MRQRNVTRWIPSTVKPVWVGVYQVELRGRVGFFYANWDGATWQTAQTTADAAASSLTEALPITVRDMRWRGRKRVLRLSVAGKRRA
ncbi:hypothetical protein LJR175_000997 [Variovorax sp. LjRoot175]|uniref:hypothetical protein n=1 Tax=Variovorax sp. LjRoot175 TaxID=3342276 RepID=UPI003ED0AAE1